MHLIYCTRKRCVVMAMGECYRSLYFLCILVLHSRARAEPGGWGLSCRYDIVRFWHIFVFYMYLVVPSFYSRNLHKTMGSLNKGHSFSKRKKYGHTSDSLNKKEWICSLFIEEWILEKSEIRVNLEWTFVLFTNFGVTTGITQGFRVIPEVRSKMSEYWTQMFTPNSL